MNPTDSFTYGFIKSENGSRVSNENKAITFYTTTTTRLPTEKKNKYEKIYR